MIIIRPAVAASLCLAAFLLPAPEAVAKSPHEVDPAQMQPALNPDFAPWSCFEAGSGITCQGSFEASYHGPSGFFCDGQEVWVSGSARAFMTRWHTTEGLATKTDVHLDDPADVFSLSPEGTGPTVTIRGHWNRHYVYPVPGDRDSRILTEVGAIWVVNEPGQGIVLHDTGPVTYEPGAEFEEIAVMHGVHAVSDDPAVVERVICSGLA